MQYFACSVSQTKVGTFDLMTADRFYGPLGHTV